MGCGCGKKTGGTAAKNPPLSAGQLLEVVNGRGGIPLRTVDVLAAKAMVRKLREAGDPDAHYRPAGSTTALPL